MVEVIFVVGIFVAFFAGIHYVLALVAKIKAETVLLEKQDKTWFVAEEAKLKADVQVVETEVKKAL